MNKMSKQRQGRLFRDNARTATKNTGLGKNGEISGWGRMRRGMVQYQHSQGAVALVKKRNNNVHVEDTSMCYHHHHWNPLSLSLSLSYTLGGVSR